MAQTPALQHIPFARDGLKNDIPDMATGGAASQTLGFPQETMMPLNAGGVPPSGQDFNGILNQLSQHMVWMNSGGLYPFDADHARAIGGYPKGAVLYSADRLSTYISTRDGNTSDPANGDGWAPFGGAAVFDVLQQRILDERNAERDRLYPVGSGLHLRHDHRNPAEALGFGQWRLISQGRALVGLNPEQSDWTGQIGGEFGTSTHTLTVEEMPTHTHGVAEYAGVGDDATHITANYNGAGVSRQTATTGGSLPHNNIPPSYVIAIWLRTA